jgi:peptide deformylase
MADRNSIISLPNEHLRQRSRRVGIISDDVRRIIEDMRSATLDWEDHRKHELGVALAAIQIDTPLRIVVIRNNFDDKSDRGFQVFINPEITKLEGEIISDYEGCLSVRDVYGKVPRHTVAKIKALDENGDEIRLKTEGFLARVFQHEIDHTHGKLFIDHIKDDATAFYRLSDDGKLEELDYEKDVRTNPVLW